MTKWSKDSWKEFKIKHIPEYKDPRQLEKALKKLEGFPPLVFAGECRNLKEDLAKATNGEAFLVQGGDCAESFEEEYSLKVEVLLGAGGSCGGHPRFGNRTTELVTG